MHAFLFEFGLGVDCVLVCVLWGEYLYLGVYCVLACVLWGNTNAWGVKDNSNAVS